MAGLVSDTRDVRELLGLRSLAARALIAAFVLTFLLVSLATSPGGGAVWVELAAWLVVSVGAITLIRTPGEAISLGVGVCLALVGPIAVNLVLAVVPVPIDGLLQAWPLAASTAIYTYMCVRGRTSLAWLGMAATLASCVLWAARTGQGAGYGISMSAINLAPLLMATFFAWTIRPAARDIFALREETTVRVAAEAADIAILEERDQQLRRLDELARPLLEHIAGGDELTGSERLAAGLLEAHLRDSLRAPTLVAPAVAAAARAARAGGTEVVLLDDHGMDEVPSYIRERILTDIAGILVAASGGTLTIRILPPSRDTLVTVLHRDGDEISRIEFGPDGHRNAQRN